MGNLLRALAPWRNRARKEDPHSSPSPHLPDSPQSPEHRWEECIRRHLKLADGTRFEDLEEPRRTWAAYSLSTVERGRGVVAQLADHGWRPGVRFLDAGCAYGGYLVAAAEAGAAEVAGIEIEPDLLKLAEELLAAYGVPGRLELGSVDDRELLRRMAGPEGFDVVTCTDVLEHVADPRHTLEVLMASLAPGGRAYIAVPNFRCPAWVRSDPHYQILGITLLPPEQARALAYAVHPWLPRYGVGDYHTLRWYRDELARLGLQTWLLNPPGAPGGLAEVAGQLREEALALHAAVQAEDKQPVREAVSAWADELLANVSGISGTNPDPAVLDEYAVQTWDLLAVKP